MNEREQLTELLKNAKLCSYPFGDQYSDSTIEKIADYLLANGVIAPPCKVWDKVYQIKTNGKIAEGIVKSIHQNRIGCTRGRWIVAAWFDNYYAQTKTAGFECGTHLYLTFDDFGKTVFLTEAEAEKALAERGKQ